MARGNKENLKPLKERTSEEQRNFHVAGGKASGEARRKKSSIQSMLKAWAQNPIAPAKLKSQAKAFGFDSDEGKALIALAMLQNAMKGNSKYMEMVLAMLGEDMPTPEAPDDGFIEALSGTAAEDWGDTDV